MSGSKLVNGPPGPISDPPPAFSLILGFPPCWLGDSPPEGRIYCPCPRGLTLSSFSSTPKPSRKQQQGLDMRVPTKPQTESATQTGGPGHGTDVPSSRPPGPHPYLHIHCFYTASASGGQHCPRGCQPECRFPGPVLNPGMDTHYQVRSSPSETRP